MEKRVLADLQNKSSSNGSTNGSSFIDTVILYPTVCCLAFTASDNAQKIVLKQAAALQYNAHTKLNI